MLTAVPVAALGGVPVFDVVEDVPPPHPIAQRNDVTGGWRATFELVPQAGTPAELRCFLRRGSHTLTETWSYLWTP